MKLRQTRHTPSRENTDFVTSAFSSCNCALLSAIKTPVTDAGLPTLRQGSVPGGNGGLLQQSTKYIKQLPAATWSPRFPKEANAVDALRHPSESVHLASTWKSQRAVFPRSGASTTHRFHGQSKGYGVAWARRVVHFDTAKLAIEPLVAQSMQADGCPSLSPAIIPRPHHGSSTQSPLPSVCESQQQCRSNSA